MQVMVQSGRNDKKEWNCNLQLLQASRLVRTAWVLDGAQIKPGKAAVKGDSLAEPAPGARY